MRLLLLSLLAITVSVYAAVESSNSWNDTPGPTWSAPENLLRTGSDPLCQLGNIHFTGGIHIDTAINPSDYYYELDVDWTQFSGSTQLTPFPSVQHSSIFVKFNENSIHHKRTYNHLGYGSLSSPMTLREGDNWIVVYVSCNGDAEPPCMYEYTFHIHKPTTPPPPTQGSVQGDPKFNGFSGQNYQVHGIANEFYNLISDVDVSVSSEFVFLSAGKCPTALNTLCYSHPGSYLGSIGIMTSTGDMIAITAGTAHHGFKSVTVNDRTLRVGDTLPLSSGSLDFVSVNGTHTVDVRVGNYYMTLENSDMFINEKVVMINRQATTAHGLIGQTWKKNADGKAIEGTVDDYLLTDRKLFSSQFKFNKFRLARN